MPIGHAVNANMAMVSNFSVHPDRAEAIRRGQEGFEFFGYAVNALVAHDAMPGRSTLFADFQPPAADRDEEIIAAAKRARPQRQRHRHPRRHPRPHPRLPRRRRRPGDLPAAGRPQQARAHLRVA